MIAKTPSPPYYAVIFTSLRTNEDRGYDAMAELMKTLAQEQEGYLGIESARNETGITISYWKGEGAIMAWKQNLQHALAQKLGKQIWYSHYQVRICKVVRDYSWEVDVTVE